MTTRQDLLELREELQEVSRSSKESLESWSNGVAQRTEMGIDWWSVGQRTGLLWRDQKGLESPWNLQFLKF